jgi:hypothetical protein
MCPNHPTSQGSDCNNSYSYNRIIQCLTVNWVKCRKTEYDCNESNPAYTDECYRTACVTEIERAFLGIKGFVVDKPD